jgi:hypothetical protein
MARDEKAEMYEETKIFDEEDIKNKEIKDRKLETLKVFTIKNLEHKFAPLYYKRITFKLVKDAKTFNFPIYFALINLLYSKKLFYPCITLLSLVITEISSISNELYERQENHQKTKSFLHLYEFLLFIQVYLLCSTKKFDRALYELIKIRKNVNDVNSLLYKILYGLCLSHCFYFDIAVQYFSEAVYLIKPMLDSYKYLEDESNIKNQEKKVSKTPESKINY